MQPQCKYWGAFQIVGQRHKQWAKFQVQKAGWEKGNSLCCLLFHTCASSWGVAKQYTAEHPRAIGVFIELT